MRVPSPKTQPQHRQMPSWCAGCRAQRAPSQLGTDGGPAIGGAKWQQPAPHTPAMPRPPRPARHFGVGHDAADECPPASPDATAARTPDVSQDLPSPGDCEEAASPTESEQKTPSESAEELDHQDDQEQEPHETLPPTFSQPQPVYQKHADVTCVEFSLHVLHFGSQQEPSPIDTELCETVVLRHMGSKDSPTFHVTCEPPPDDERFELKWNASQVELKRGKELTISLSLMCRCTCFIDTAFSILFTEVPKSNALEKLVRNVRSGSIACMPEAAPMQYQKLLPMKVVSDLSTKLDFFELEFARHIGEGSYAHVWLGKWRGTQVAIKLLKEQDVEEETRSEFEREVSFMNKLRSPFVVNFIGAVIVPGKLCLVTEFMSLGSVSTVLEKQTKQLSWLVKLKLAFDCASGMAFLHNNGMLHRDLKPDNVLVVSLSSHAPISCKVCDFGADIF
eukprot:TRINITY_DN932_c0_g1_i3.p1 TRINITY_DN932_c0_g1~~TRINITY_DN932_c0_g1_i3.p1  ORF type:complete len:449 (-),score=82.09 TRINITY_DN932_c0_g1_i3:791-2137(-)